MAEQTDPYVEPRLTLGKFLAGHRRVRSRGLLTCGGTFAATTTVCLLLLLSIAKTFATRRAQHGVPQT